MVPVPSAGWCEPRTPNETIEAVVVGGNEESVEAEKSGEMSDGEVWDCMRERAH